LRNRKDGYWKKAKKEGYRARSAYKLKQINERFDVISSGDSVIDIGAAPGGWLQVAKEVAGDEGKVVGVDIQKIRPLEGVKTIVGDITCDSTIEHIKNNIADKFFDVVLSDASPDLTGNWSIDHARSIDLAKNIFRLSKDVLSPHGNFLIKVFQGDMYEDFYEKISSNFEYTKAHSPDASRSQSSEIYLIGKGFLKKPVEPGEQIEVEIVDKGTKGDGIARVDGFVVFVPGVEIGDKILVKIEKVTNNFAKAKKVR